MAQAIHAGFQLNERAKRTDAHHIAGKHAAHRVLIFHVVPGSWLQLFVAQLDTLALHVQ